MSKSAKILFKLIISLIAITATGADIIEKSAMVELAGHLWGHSSADFADETQNKLNVLPAGTRATVDDVREFKGTGNYGLCLKVVPIGPVRELNKDCYWVYYDRSKKYLKLFSTPETEKGKQTMAAWNDSKSPQPVSSFVERTKEFKPVSVPRPGIAAITTANINALQGPPVLPMSSADVLNSPAGALALSIVKKADALKGLTKSLDPTAGVEHCDDCPMCVPKIVKFQECNSKNNYFEKELDTIFSPNNPIRQMLAKKTPAKYIKDACIAGSLLSFGGPYKYCNANESGKPKKSVPAACVSERYTSLIRNSFDTIGDCLGDYLAGSQENAKAGMVNMFGLMSIESGMHINAKSAEIWKDGKIVAGGAGGSGQLTGGAIKSINQNELQLMRQHLEQKSAPECKTLLKVLAEPMPDSLGKSCSRISIGSDNPLKNMMYTVAYQKQARVIIRKLGLENRAAKRALAKFSDKEKNQLEAELDLWAHNSGDGALRGALHDYLGTLNVGSEGNLPSDIKSFMKGLQAHMRRANSDRHNVDEPVKFWNKIKTRMKDLDSNIGQGTCTVSDS
jgi:hypothetical protein